jgi:hypothetical protein
MFVWQHTYIILHLPIYYQVLFKLNLQNHIIFVLT